MLEEVLTKFFPTLGFPPFGNTAIDEIARGNLIPQSERENVSEGVILGHLDKLLMSYMAKGIQGQVDRQVRLVLNERDYVRGLPAEVPLLVAAQPPEKRAAFIYRQEECKRKKIALLSQQEPLIYLKAQKRFPWVLTQRSNTYTDGNGNVTLRFPEIPHIELMDFGPLQLTPIAGRDDSVWVFIGDKRWRDSRYSKILNGAARGFNRYFSEIQTMSGDRHYANESVRLKKEDGKFTWLYACNPVSQLHSLEGRH